MLRTASLAAVVFAVACDSGSQSPPTKAAAKPAESTKAAAPVERATPKKVTVRDAGLMTPESVAHDRDADIYLVSNIFGKPLDLDDNGFISRVSPEGKVIALKWIDGASENVELNAPKGLGISGDKIFVADIDTVRMFDRKSGLPAGSIEIKSASFLNGMAVGPDGTVYVSDSGLDEEFKSVGTDAIYKLDGDKAETVIRDEKLGGPNGMVVTRGALWVVSFGTGQLHRIDDGKIAQTLKPPSGQLDGLVAVGDVLVMSSWEAKALIRKKGESFDILEDGLEAPADIGFDEKRKRIMVPLFNDNALVFVSVQ